LEFLKAQFNEIILKLQETKRLLNIKTSSNPKSSQVQTF